MSQKRGFDSGNSGRKTSKWRIKKVALKATFHYSWLKSHPISKPTRWIATVRCVGFLFVGAFVPLENAEHIYFDDARFLLFLVPVIDFFNYAGHFPTRNTHFSGNAAYISIIYLHQFFDLSCLGIFKACVVLGRCQC